MDGSGPSNALISPRYSDNVEFHFRFLPLFSPLCLSYFLKNNQVAEQRRATARNFRPARFGVATHPGCAQQLARVFLSLYEMVCLTEIAAADELPTSLKSGEPFLCLPPIVASPLSSPASAAYLRTCLRCGSRRERKRLDSYLFILLFYFYSPLLVSLYVRYPFLLLGPSPSR